MADLIIILPILLFSVMVHEIAHGWVALRCGDPTARAAGRLTLNPIPHIDPFMTILVPLFLIISHSGIIFGGAKPVPVNPFLLRGGERDYVKVSAAGCVSNILLALAAFFLTLVAVFIFRSTGIIIAAKIIGFLNIVIFINLILANFNLLPVPPLDGSHILAYFLRGEAKQAYQNLQRRGFLIFIVFIMLASWIPVGRMTLLGVLILPSMKLMEMFRMLQGI